MIVKSPYGDPVRGKVALLGTLLNWHPYRQSFINIAHFNLPVTPIRQPGETSFAHLWAGARCWNAAFAVSYDARQRFWQNQVIQATGPAAASALNITGSHWGPFAVKTSFAWRC